MPFTAVMTGTERTTTDNTTAAIACAVAGRLGHADGGALLLRTYRHVRPGETRAALDAIGAPGSALLATDRRRR
jgi:hypothetical protein